MRDIKKDTVFYDEFVVNDNAGNRITGLVDGNFTKYLYNPSGTEVSGSITVTVSELGNGLYRVDSTPNALGEWVLMITHAIYFPFGKTNNYQCVNHLLNDSLSEPPQEIPENTPDIFYMSNQLYRKIIKDKVKSTKLSTTTGREDTLMNDGTTVRNKRNYSDDGTTTIKDAAQSG